MVPDASGWTHMSVALGTLAPRVICESTHLKALPTLLVIPEAEALTASCYEGESARCLGIVKLWEAFCAE